MRKCIECKNERKIKGRGRCSGCYKRMMRKGLPNDYENTSANSGTFRTGHIPKNYGVACKNKEYLSRINMGKNNPRWKGKHARSHHVYRKQVERFIGRKLKKGEIVHHIDGDHTNNSPDNITLFQSHSEHMKWHWKMQKEKKIGGRMVKSK